MGTAQCGSGREQSVVLDRAGVWFATGKRVPQYGLGRLVPYPSHHSFLWRALTIDETYEYQA